MSRNTTRPVRNDGSHDQESTVTIEFPVSSARLLAGIVKEQEIRAEESDEPAEQESAATYAVQHERIISALRDAHDDPEPDHRQADLWKCLDCANAQIDVVGKRECSVCGGELDYYGELTYENKELHTSEGSE